MPEPAVELGPQTEFDPDLVVVRMDQIGGAKFTEPPLLVWIVNADSPQPELTVFELQNGRYALVAKASGSCVPAAERGAGSTPRMPRPWPPPSRP